MRLLRRSPFAFMVCVGLAMLPLSAPAAPAHGNVVRARGADRSADSGGERVSATLGLPPGSQQLVLDDGSSEYSVGVTDDSGTVGAQAVYLNCFTPPADQLPLTIDTVSALFPTTDQFGSTGLRPRQTFQALVYVDPESTGDPRNAELVSRVTYDLAPSNTVFQNVTLTDPVTVLTGTVYVGFTNPYNAVTHEATFPAAVDTDTISGASYVFHDLGQADDFDGEHLADAENGGFQFPEGTFLIRAFYTTGGSVRICWSPGTGDGMPPPENNRVCTSGPSGAACGECAPAITRDTLLGYNVYRGTSPNVTPTPANLFTSVPPGQTTVASGVSPSGSFFVITGVYDTGESEASNEVGVKPATVTKVTVKTTKVVAKGSDFGANVQVFLDGIPFLQPATVKGGKKVTQKGTLITGESARAYITAHGGSARITFRNPDGTTATVAAR